MLGFFKKKNEIQKLVEKDGIEHATDRFADVICDMIKSRELAYQFILEEVEAASTGNQIAKKFSSESGISSMEYEDAMQKSCPEIDGVNGPQQFLNNISAQLISDTDLMVEFRTKIADKIMRKYCVGKYANNNDRIENLMQSLKNILEDDEDVMPALTPNIPVPENAKARYIDFREKNISSAKKIISILLDLTGDDVETIINNSLENKIGKMSKEELFYEVGTMIFHEVHGKFALKITQGIAGDSDGNSEQEAYMEVTNMILRGDLFYG